MRRQADWAPGPEAGALESGSPRADSARCAPAAPGQLLAGELSLRGEDDSPTDALPGPRQFWDTSGKVSISSGGGLSPPWV